MATKDQSLFFKNKQDFVVNDNLNGQFKNLNLNQNNQFFDEVIQPSKNHENGNKEISNYDYNNNSQITQNSTLFGNSKLSSSFANLNTQKEYGKKEAKTLNANSSTLSLHITAYENSIDATSGKPIDGQKDGKEKTVAIKNWKALKELSNGSSSVVNYAFELPRQQQQDQNPEVMQFKASQRLSKVNQSHPSKMENIFTPNDDFCTMCGTILPLPQFAPTKVSCDSCGCHWRVKEKKSEIVYVREKIYEKTVLESNAPVDNGEEGAASVEHFCSRCEHNLASYSTMQTRSADEGQTVFYTCLRCGKKDIEYS